MDPGALNGAGPKEPVAVDSAKAVRQRAGLEVAIIIVSMGLKRVGPRHCTFREGKWQAAGTKSVQTFAAPAPGSSAARRRLCRDTATKALQTEGAAILANRRPRIRHESGVP